jgi:hypothetical protein
MNNPETDTDESQDDGAMDSVTPSLFLALRRGESFHDIRSIVDWRPDSVREPDRSSGGLLALHEAVARGAPRNVVTFLHWRWLGAIRTMAGRYAPGLPLHYVSSVSAVESVAFLVERYPGALGIKNGGGGDSPSRRHQSWGAPGGCRADASAPSRIDPGAL